MNAYLDASVVLRLVLRQAPALDLSGVSLGVCSSLVEVECLRTIDCARLGGDLTDEQGADARSGFIEMLAETEMIDVERATLRRAAQPMPTRLRTLDAIHLATALIWTEATGKRLTMATHDVLLGVAARAHGLPVVGS